MDDRAYWIWAQQIFGVGHSLPWGLFQKYQGGLREFYEGGARLWNTLPFITEQHANALCGFTVSEAQARLEYAEKVGWDVITPESPEYPEQLRNISCPPAVLYVKGELPDLETRPAIGVAGARKATADSLRAASSFGYQLAAGGAAVISGGAVGVDAAALTGAMGAVGRVVSVLPTDLDSPYLSSNASLRRSILQSGGALVSEYFSQRNPDRGTFQVRNRLISGLSCGMLLIQAGGKSGTMIYAKHAKEQNRDLFVYPGPEGAEEFVGSRALLMDGAMAVSSGEEILEEYTVRFQRRKVPPRFSGLFNKVKQPIRPECRKFSEKQGPARVLADPGPEPQGEKKALLDALGEELLSLAELEARTGMGASVLLGLLTEMELDGQVESAPGKRYRRT